MYQIDNSTAQPVKLASTPPGTPGFFTDGDPAGGLAATIVPAEWLNSIQQELINVLLAAGITPNKAAFNQLALAIQSGQGGYGTDTGLANAYVVALSTAPSPLENGMAIAFKVKNANTAASTLNLNGEGVLPIVGLGLHPLQGGELVANAVANLQYVVEPSVNSGLGGWVLISSAGGAQQLGDGSYVTTPVQFDNTTKLASTAFVQRALGNYAGRPATIVGNIVLTPSQGGTFLVLGAAAANTITLPLIASVPTGWLITLTSGQGSVTTLQRAGSDLIAVNQSPVTSLALSAGDCTTVVSDGSQWRVIGGSIQLAYAAAFGNSIGSAGYQKLPTGLIIQWLPQTSSGSTAPNLIVTFPIAFPNGYLAAASMGTGGNVTVSVSASSKTGLSATTYAANTGAVQTSSGVYLVIIGY